MPEEEENESVASSNGRCKIIDGWSGFENTNEGSTIKHDLSTEVLPKKKRNLRGRRNGNSNEGFPDRKHSGTDGNSSGSADEVKESIERSVVNCTEGERMKSRRSRRIELELRNSAITYFEEESDSNNEKVVSKKSGKVLKKKTTKKMGGKLKKGKGRKGSSKIEDITEDSEPGYEVEKIIDMKYTNKGKREFLLRWKGFTSKDDTWEPEENLDCKDLVEQYLKNKENLDGDGENSDEDDVKLSGLKKNGKENTGTRTRSREGRSGNPQSEISDTPGKRSSRLSARATKGNRGTVVTRNQDEEEPDEEERGQHSRRSIGRRTNESNRKRESESDSTLKNKRSKKDQDKENVDGGKVSSDDSGVEDATEYEVQKILDVRYLKNGSREFFIKWKGFSANHNTWEPEKHLNCSDKLKEFLQELEKVSSLPMRELRFSRKKTDRLVIESPRTRKLSTRIQRQPRKSYMEED